MNNSRRHSRSGLKLFFAAAIVWASSNATAADGYVPFEGEKTTWYEGFDRYDFIMDDATGAITTSQREWTGVWPIFSMPITIPSLP